MSSAYWTILKDYTYAKLLYKDKTVETTELAKKMKEAVLPDFSYEFKSLHPSVGLAYTSAGVFASCGSGTFYSNSLSRQWPTCAARSSSVPHGYMTLAHIFCAVAERVHTLIPCKVFKNTDSGQIWTIIISNQRGEKKPKMKW